MTVAHSIEWAAYEADNARANAAYAEMPWVAGVGERSAELGVCPCGAVFEHNQLGRRRKYCRRCSPPKEARQ